MQFDARNPDVEFVQCAVCENGITGGRWFARIAHDEWTVALCCPLCLPGSVREKPEALHEADRDSRKKSPCLTRRIITPDEDFAILSSRVEGFLLSRLRNSVEWGYVTREIDIRLERV
jgi:hypothetical protein